MNYEQSQMLETLYKRFKKLDCEKTQLFYDTERKLYNTDLKYKTDEDINEFIRIMHNNILKLEKQDEDKRK